MEKIKELTRVLLVLFLAIFLFPILAQGTSEMETYPIPESNWIKLTNHLAGADSPAWSPDGSEIFYNTWDETPLATVYKMKADGSNPTSLGISEVQYPHVSPDGSRIVTTGFGYVWVCNYDGSGHHHIYGVYDHGGGCPGACHHYPKWSPKGDKIVVPEQTSYSPHYSHIITINTDGTNPTSLTDSDQAYQFPFWSPDGTRIAYQKTDHSAYKSDIWIMDADGGNKMRITYFEDAMLPVWSPDGARMFFIRLGSDWSSWSQRHIYCMNVDGTNVVQLTNSGGEWSPAVSPDGKWLAFAAYDENGIRNIYKTELPSFVSATVDIDPDTLNLKSNGEWITAYIELPEDYSVSDIDPNSILLNGTISVDAEGPATVGDYDLDNIPDLMVKFDRAAIIEWLDTNDYGEDTGKYYEINLTITGTVSGTKFTGTDHVKVLKR